MPTMVNGEPGNFSRAVPELTQGPAHPDLWAPIHKQLADNDADLDERLEQVRQDLDEQSQAWELEGAVRHVVGEFELRNRGIRWGCNVSKSSTAARNLSLSAGQCFMFGMLLGVDAAENTASVPGNSGAEPVTVYSFLYVDGDNRIRLAVTSIGDEPPLDAIILDEVTIPAGNTGANDQYLANVDVTPVARVEPNWPAVQVDPPYAQVDLPLLFPGDYNVSFDVVSFKGGQAPGLICRAADRAENTFRVYMPGAADQVKVRYTAHTLIGSEE